MHSNISEHISFPLPCFSFLTGIFDLDPLKPFLCIWNRERDRGRNKLRRADSPDQYILPPLLKENKSASVLHFIFWIALPTPPFHFPNDSRRARLYSTHWIIITSFALRVFHCRRRKDEALTELWWCKYERSGICPVRWCDRTYNEKSVGWYSSITVALI